MSKILYLGSIKWIAAILTILLLSSCGVNNGNGGTDNDKVVIEFSGDQMKKDLIEAIDTGKVYGINYSEEDQGNIVYSVTTVNCPKGKWTVKVPAGNYTVIATDENGNTTRYEQSNSSGSKASVNCTENGGRGSCTASGDAECTSP